VGVRKLLAILSAVLLGISFVLNATLKILSPEKIWFGARAVAESIKSITWRYIVGGEPFSIDLEPQTADLQFVDRLRSIMQERRSLAWKYGVEPADHPQITQQMRMYRASSTRERLLLYVRERIVDQRSWYGTKANESQSLHMKWFWVAIMSQAVALTSAIVMIQALNSPVNLTGAFSAVAASALAWLQMKNYQDLAQAYALAAHELGLIEAQSEYIRTEAELSSFVANSENAISREHTMWVARRDVRL